MENTLEMQPLRAVGEIDKPPQPAKTDIDLVERVDTNTTIPATYVDAVAARLSKGHRDYLIERHGTLDLDPVPGISPADPYNWPAWKVSGVNGPMSSVKHANYSENDEPDSSCLPRIDGNLHGERHHPLVQRHHQGIRRLHAAGELSHITTNRCSWWRATSVEAVIQSIRTSAHFPAVFNMQSGLQCWVCQKPGLCIDCRV